MKKTLTVIAILVAIVLFAVDGFSQYFHGRRGFRDSMYQSPLRILRMLKVHREDLKINDDQLKAIDDLTNSFEEKMIDARTEASKQRLELRKIMQDREKLDYAKLKEALSKSAEYKHDMLIDGLKLRDEIDKILTPEQKEALKTLRLERFIDRRDDRRRGAREERKQRPSLNREPIKEDF